MTTIQAAKANRLILWADDVGLRTLASNEGVANFGTNALLEALGSKGRLTQPDIAASIEILRNQYCVDFPLDPTWLTRSAEDDSWQPGPALLTLTRPSTWSDLPRGLDVWQKIANKAGDHDPANVAPWVFAASTGISTAINVPAAIRLVAGVLVAAVGAVNGDSAAFASCVDAVKTASEAEGIPDPTELALRETFELLTQHMGTAEAATALARLGSQLTDDARETLRRVIFGL